MFPWGVNMLGVALEAETQSLSQKATLQGDTPRREGKWVSIKKRGKETWPEWQKLSCNEAKIQLQKGKRWV